MSANMCIKTKISASFPNNRLYSINSCHFLIRTQTRDTLVVMEMKNYRITNQIIAGDHREPIN